MKTRSNIFKAHSAHCSKTVVAICLGRFANKRIGKAFSIIHNMGVSEYGGFQESVVINYYYSLRFHQ